MGIQLARKAMERAHEGKFWRKQEEGASEVQEEEEEVKAKAGGGRSRVILKQEMHERSLSATLRTAEPR